MFLEISQFSHENTCNFIKKETLAHVFSCEFCEISKNTFFTENVMTTASIFIKARKCLKKSYTTTEITSYFAAAALWFWKKLKYFWIRITLSFQVLSPHIFSSVTYIRVFGTKLSLNYYLWQSDMRTEKNFGDLALI